MTVDRPDNTEKRPLWKRRGIRSLAGGTGLGLVLGCAIGAFFSSRSRPKSSNLDVVRTVEPKTVPVHLPVESPVADNTPDNTETIPLWKRRGILLLTGGTGLSLVLVCAIGAFDFYRSRPKPWNLNAIRAVESKTAAVDLSVGLVPDTTPAGAGQDVAASAPDPGSVMPAAPGSTDQDTTSSASEQSQNAEQGLAGIVTVGLRNTTSEDITLPQAALVMESEEGSHILHNSKFAVDRDYFMPAGHTVSVTLMADDPCEPGNTPETCVESYFNGMDEIVLFDKPARYEIHIPLKAIRLMRVEPKKLPETRAAAPTGTGVDSQQPSTRGESRHRSGGQAALDPLHPYDE